jgi:hypothetical protein
VERHGCPDHLHRQRGENSPRASCSTRNLLARPSTSARWAGWGSGLRPSAPYVARRPRHHRCWFDVTDRADRCSTWNTIRGMREERAEEVRRRPRSLSKMRDQRIPRVRNALGGLTRSATYTSCGPVLPCRGPRAVGPGVPRGTCCTASRIDRSLFCSTWNHGIIASPTPDTSSRSTASVRTDPMSVPHGTKAMHERKPAQPNLLHLFHVEPARSTTRTTPPMQVAAIGVRSVTAWSPR